MISLLVAIKPNSTGVWIAAKRTETLLDITKKGFTSTDVSFLVLIMVFG